jgi:hypothetical protein
VNAVGWPLALTVPLNVAKPWVTFDAAAVVTAGAVGGPEVNSLTGPFVVPAALVATSR